MIVPDHWDSSEKKVITHPNRNLLNATIRSKIADLEKQFLEQSLNGSIAYKVNTQKDQDFFKYANKKIDAWRKTQTTSTINHKLSYLKKLKEYKSVLKVSEVNKEFLAGYEQYCRQQGNIHNTVWSAIKFIRTIIRCAVDDRITENNPMRGYKAPGYKSPIRQYVTAEELDRIEEVAATSQNQTYRNAANWFLFSAYSGLRYGDAAKFTQKMIVNGRIILRTEKAQTDVSIKVHPKLYDVIGRLSNKLTSNQDYNRSLKAVAELAKINKPITSHIARHTFAVMFLQKGGSMEVLSKLLGHTTIKTTEIYGKITDLRIDAEMDKVWDS